MDLEALWTKGEAGRLVNLPPVVPLTEPPRPELRPLLKIKDIFLRNRCFMREKLRR